MPDEKKTTAAASKPAVKQLSPAAESSDPAVHQLLAELQTALLNQDEDAAKGVRDDLAKLGFSA